MRGCPAGIDGGAVRFYTEPAGVKNVQGRGHLMRITRKEGFWRYLATTLQKAPWIVGTSRLFWRFLQPRFTAGVVGVVLNADGQVLLVEHVFHPHAPWGLPGGWLQSDEQPAEAVQREIYEELGLPVRAGKIILIERTEHKHLDIAYLCGQTGKINHLNSELLNFGWFDPLELPRLQPFHYRAIMCLRETPPELSVV